MSERTVFSRKAETRALLDTKTHPRFIDESPLMDNGQGNILQVPVELYERKIGVRDASPSSSASRIGTSDTGVTSPSTPAEPAHHLLFLKSSAEIFSAKECAKFLRSFPLRPRSGDVLFLVMGIKHEDTELDCNVVKGRTMEFIMNGLNAAGGALGIPNLFDVNHWKHIETCNEYERAWDHILT